MIVKDEAAGIERCLASVRPYIDHWVIHDTGSTDGTPELVRKALEGIPGQLYHSEFKDFSTNRNMALTPALAAADYVLLLDGDETLEGALDKASLADFSYWVYLYQRESAFRRTMLVPSKYPWQFVGSVHEYITCPTRAVPAMQLKDLKIQHMADPKGDNYSKFEMYAPLLEADLQKDPANTRTLFYLGQTYMALNQFDKSAYYYKRRVDAGGWLEEQWYAQLELARLAIKMRKPDSETVDTFLRAYEMRPWRAESLCELCTYLRKQSRHEASYLFSRAGLSITYPSEDILFIDTAVYRYRMLDEAALAAYYTAHYLEAQDYGHRAVEADPGNKRLRENMEWYMKAGDD